jgi:hypothetical protein
LVRLDVAGAAGRLSGNVRCEAQLRPPSRGRICRGTELPIGLPSPRQGSTAPWRRRLGHGWQGRNMRRFSRLAA